jgi:hypothetical protein
MPHDVARFSSAHALEEMRTAERAGDWPDEDTWPSFGALLPPDVEPTEPQPASRWTAVALVPLIIAACMISWWLGRSWAN